MRAIEAAGDALYQKSDRMRVSAETFQRDAGRMRADGGETSLPNLLLLCSHHHRLVHEADWKVEWWGRDRPAFVDPRGQIPKQVYSRALEALG